MQSVTVRAMPADIADYRFVRGGTVDVSVVVRVYNDRSVRIGAASTTLSSTALSIADMLGGTLPDGACWFSLSYRSTGAATTMGYETGMDPDSSSVQLVVQASSGSYDTIVGGRTPLA